MLASEGCRSSSLAFPSRLDAANDRRCDCFLGCCLLGPLVFGSLSEVLVPVRLVVQVEDYFVEDLQRDVRLKEVGCLLLAPVGLLRV